MAKLEKANGTGDTKAVAAEVEIPKTRSPNYPTYKLETALEKTRTLYDAYKRHPIPVAAVAQKMGFTHGSSTAGQALAAVKAYGLVDIQGNGDERKISVSEDAAKILAKHPDADKLLQKAAVAPKIHKELVVKFWGPDGIAPDESIKYYLLWERPEPRFNDKIVDTFLRQFKSTMAFAKLDSSAKMSDDPAVDDNAQSYVRPSVGDYVQWVSQGAAQFQAPKRVAGFSSDDQYAFIEGEKCGVLTAELTVEKKSDKPMVMPQIDPPANPLFVPPPPQGVPISVVMGKGAAQVITIPQMTAKAFEFFKNQLNAFKEAIVFDDNGEKT